MVLKVSRAHATEPALKQVTWDLYAGTFVMPKAKKVGTDWLDVPVSDFVMDIWLAQHGWEAWVETNGKKQPRYVMASVSDDIPAQPDSSKPLHTVPVHGAPLGGRRECVIKGKEVTAAFLDLLEGIAAELRDLNDMLLPVLSVMSKETDYGLAPVFSIENLIPRPKHWQQAIVSFK